MVIIIIIIIIIRQFKYYHSQFFYYPQKREPQNSYWSFAINFALLLSFTIHFELDKLEQRGRVARPLVSLHFSALSSLNMS